jgi:hypothetical protein
LFKWIDIMVYSVLNRVIVKKNLYYRVKYTIIHLNILLSKQVLKVSTVKCEHRKFRKSLRVWTWQKIPPYLLLPMSKKIPGDY